MWKSLSPESSVNPVQYYNPPPSPQKVKLKLKVVLFILCDGSCMVISVVSLLVCWFPAGLMDRVKEQ